MTDRERSADARLEGALDLRPGPRAHPGGSLACTPRRRANPAGASGSRRRGMRRHYRLRVDHAYHAGPRRSPSKKPSRSDGCLRTGYGRGRRTGGRPPRSRRASFAGLWKGAGREGSRIGPARAARAGPSHSACRASKSCLGRLASDMVAVLVARSGHSIAARPRRVENGRERLELAGRRREP